MIGTRCRCPLFVVARISWIEERDMLWPILEDFWEIELNQIKERRMTATLEIICVGSGLCLDARDGSQSWNHSGQW